MTDILEYRYGDAFDFERFLEVMLPVLEEYIEAPCGDEEMPDTGYVSMKFAVDDVQDHGEELTAMLRMVGVDKMDGRSGFDKNFDMAFIECRAYTTEGMSTYALKVDATLKLLP